MPDFTFSFTIGDMTEDEADTVQVSIVEHLLYVHNTMTPVNFTEVKPDPLSSLIDGDPWESKARDI